MDALPAKTFDTSGKSPALFHHRAICRTAHSVASARLQAKNSDIEVVPARYSE
jgi:hypothetical protein